MKNTHPAFRIVANGTEDLSRALSTRLMYISVTDAAGFESDSVEIRLADGDWDTDPFALPAGGAELDVFLGYDGYESPGLAHMGLFVVDEIEPSGWPAQLTITGRGTPYEGSKFGKKRHADAEIARVAEEHEAG